jgi:hypothetical protein
MKTTEALEIDRLARQLGVRPPPLPLTDEGQEIAAALLGDEDREWLEATIAAAQERRAKARVIREAGRTPRLTTRETVIALASWAEGQKWRNATDFYAYRAFLDVAYRANKLHDIGMSQYQLSEAIGGSNRANWEAIKRLERRGLIKCETLQSDVRDESLAYRYALAVPDDVLQSNVSLVTTIPPECQDSRNNATLVPDLFKGREGLSKAALRVYEALDPEQAQTAAELGRKLDRNRSSVGRTLKQLEAFGLVEKAEDGWLKADADLDKLAEEHGAAEAAKRKRAYNERQREGYRIYLEHKRGNGDAESPSANDVQARAGAVVSEARETSRDDGGAALPRRSVKSLSSDDGPGIPTVRMETMGHDPSSLRSNTRARQSIGGMELGSGRVEREAACVDCGQVQTFSAPDLRPYSCAHCKGKLEFVDELAMA